MTLTIPLPTPKSGARTAPPDLQWMPPGAHTIRGTQDGAAVERFVTVDDAAAERLQAALEQMLTAAALGEGDRPYFDFNHDDGPASAWPLEFYWAGDDPHTGGIRARLEWSALGREAVLGRTFRRFSPSFFVDENGAVTGAPVNMGGLVNRAAFRGIQPIWTKEGPQPNPQTNLEIPPPMKSLLTLAAKLGFIADADADEATAIVQFNAKANALLGAGAELAALRAQLQTAQDDVIRARQAHAASVVERAALEGRIPPRDEAVRARWARLIEDDPANAALLPEPNPALRAVVSARQAHAPFVPAAAAPEHPFLAKARELAREKQLSEADAIVACGWQHPALYEEYRASLLSGAPEMAA